MADATQAQAATTETTAAETLPTVDLNPQSQHDALAAQLADPNWKPGAAEKEPEAAPEETPTGEQPPETTEDAATETAPVAGEESEHEEEAEDKAAELGKRFRIKDDATRRFVVLQKEGIAPEVAFKLAYGEPAEAAHEPVAQQEDPLVALQQQLTELDTKLAEYDEELPTAESRKLHQQRAELAAEIKVETRFRERDAQHDAKTKQDAAAQAQQIQTEFKAKAIERFPAITDLESDVRKEANRLYEEYRGSSFLQKPEAPLTLAEQAAGNVARVLSQKNGTSFESELAKLDTKAPAKAAPVPAVTVKKPAAKAPVASGNNGTHRPDQPLTGADKWKPVSTSTKDEYAHLQEMLYTKP